jgi:hypothetical protein
MPLHLQCKMGSLGCLGVWVWTGNTHITSSSYVFHLHLSWGCSPASLLAQNVSILTGSNHGVYSYGIGQIVGLRVSVWWSHLFIYVLHCGQLRPVPWCSHSVVVEVGVGPDGRGGHPGQTPAWVQSERGPRWRPPNARCAHRPHQSGSSHITLCAPEVYRSFTTDA